MRNVVFIFFVLSIYPAGCIFVRMNVVIERTKLSNGRECANEQKIVFDILIYEPILSQWTDEVKMFSTNQHKQRADNLSEFPITLHNSDTITPNGMKNREREREKPFTQLIWERKSANFTWPYFPLIYMRALCSLAKRSISAHMWWNIENSDWKFSQLYGNGENKICQHWPVT